jgi:hypothetical protein
MPDVLMGSCVHCGLDVYFDDDWFPVEAGDTYSMGVYTVEQDGYLHLDCAYADPPDEPSRFVRRGTDE